MTHVLLPAASVPFLNANGTVALPWRRVLERLAAETEETGVTAGTYAPPTSITVDAAGKITAIT